MIDFAPATCGTTTEFNFGRKKHWQVTLTQNTTFVFYNGDKGDEVQILITQGSNPANLYQIIWPSTVQGVGPNIAPSGTVLVTLVFDGTYWRFKGGSSQAMPSKITTAAMGLMTVLTAANVGMTVKLTAGSGTGVAEIGRLPAVQRVYSGSGAGVGSGTLLMEINGSGSYKTAKWGGIAVGMNDPSGRLDLRANSGYLLPNGNFRTRGTMSGASTLTLSPLGAAATNSVVCVKAGGTLGYRTVSATGSLNGTTCN